MALRDELRAAAAPLVDDVGVLGVLLWGSTVTGEATPRSDVDVCVVAGPDRTVDEVLRVAWRTLHVTDDGVDLDVKVFEELPMFLKAAVLEDHEVLLCPDEPALYEHLFHYRKLWEDQAHRQRLDADEVRAMLGRKAGR